MSSPVPSTRECKGWIHSIESCGTVDGPGIRYVVFFQVCPMRCQYFHNPDTWEYGKGSLMSVHEVLEGFYSNLPFYRNGGVTVTGGEPMMQMDFLTELFRDLKRSGIHTCLDTSGIMFNPHSERFMAQLGELLPLTDLVLLDIKHMSDERHRRLTGHTNRQILSFARHLDEQGVPVWIRHVVVPGITLYREYLEELGTFMASLHNVQALDVLPYHTLGRSKYEKLGLPYPLEGTREAAGEEAAAARQLILAAYKKAKLC